MHHTSRDHRSATSEWSIPRFLPRARDKVGRVLDRANRYGVPQLMAVTLGLLSWFQAGSFLVDPTGFQESPTWSTVVAAAHPYIWAMVFLLAGGGVLVGALLDRDFVQGASLVLCAAWVLTGFLILYPLLGGGGGLPDRIGQYMGNAVFCMINQLLWRLRAAERVTR